jgi:hypothetical protein
MAFLIQPQYSWLQTPSQRHLALRMQLLLPLPLLPVCVARGHPCHHPHTHHTLHARMHIGGG